MSKQTKDGRAERLLHDMPLLANRLKSARQACGAEPPEWAPSRSVIHDLREALGDLETQVALLQKTLSVA